MMLPLCRDKRCADLFDTAALHRDEGKGSMDDAATGLQGIIQTCSAQLAPPKAMKQCYLTSPILHTDPPQANPLIAEMPPTYTTLSSIHLKRLTAAMPDTTSSYTSPHSDSP
eukprot:1136362-Pelagomonas_calceolata.AAC.4